MSKAIREFDGKNLLSKFMVANGVEEDLDVVKVVQITPKTDLNSLPEKFPWLEESGTKLVAKPDQLIKRRGKSNLIKLNSSWEEIKAWIAERRNKVVNVGNVSGILDHFLVEPFLPHDQSDEYYVCIQNLRDGDEILFYHEGGINIGDVDSKAIRLLVPISSSISEKDLKSALLSNIPLHRQDYLASYLFSLLNLYRTAHFTYLEINPLVMTENPTEITALDMAAKLDESARFECSKIWGNIEFPPSFGKVTYPEEDYISSLDEKTGASLKLNILNPKGRVWTLVAGGGASVIYADTICDYGFADELANYGEYSGAPTESLTYSYTKTILDLMTREFDPKGKILFIGGGIANFTNIAQTFKGIIRALDEMKEKLKSNLIKFYVRRAGPNYQEGLNRMREFGVKSGLDIEVYGPETHITSIVAMAFNKPVFSLDFDDSKLLETIDPKLRQQKRMELEIAASQPLVSFIH